MPIDVPNWTSALYSLASYVIPFDLKVCSKFLTNNLAAFSSMTAVLSILSLVSKAGVTPFAENYVLVYQIQCALMQLDRC
jgi:hypothetical protein